MGKKNKRQRAATRQMTAHHARVGGVKKKNKRKANYTAAAKSVILQGKRQQAVDSNYLAQTAAKRNADRSRNARVPYRCQDRILLVGEGNFSFARALMHRLAAAEGPRTGGIVATSFDSHEELVTKYPAVEEILQELHEGGVIVVHGVDARALEQHTLLRLAAQRLWRAAAAKAEALTMSLATTPVSVSDAKGKGEEEAQQGDKHTVETQDVVDDDHDAVEKEVDEDQHLDPIIASSQPDARTDSVFDKIVFNFPHTGCGVKDTQENNAAHHAFMTQFFKSCLHMLPAENGEIHVTLKHGEPYSSWKVPGAANSTRAMRMQNAIPFLPSLYPGYEHRRTNGVAHTHARINTFITGQGKREVCGARTYVFSTGKQRTLAKVIKGKRKGKGHAKALKKLKRVHA